jgi:hypothetical protein
MIGLARRRFPREIAGTMRMAALFQGQVDQQDTSAKGDL